MNPYRDKLLAFIDCETSGLNSQQHEILEMGLILYSQQTDQVMQEWEVKVAPRTIETADPDALKINGFSKNANLYTKNIQSSIIKFNNLVENCILIGQNISFDVAFLEKYLTEFNIAPKYDRRKIDTMSLAWGYVYNKDLNGLSLKDLCTHFNISNLGAHGALTDCKRTLGLYKCLMSHYQK